ncbi:cyclopropane-fatty-acyl-phospholipid synthase [Novosphingobium marinum]|uniref:Cyclopropane-fatty-acyl-phospholipid synthase n=1 Tax=Novosphingobium marinum TaxID=1514948 RepID=A0A7Z0BUM9_9SPHN|nr:cyclopropane-fatty-acyl-phospholipid synthase family protein [Novosphingobium marinum]NYH95373.1 cyclopropane-fatty-acyl-phospholipid synthase [Novosphingobium marinum]GGC26543.1 cyclopropane-fatty-acyl-phospholipid synthase [Novosphingobium marinum]
MSSRLFDKGIGSVIKRGRLDVTHADGRKVSFGTPEPGFPEVALRMADRKVTRDILMDPRLGAAETFMDGRLVIEQGDIMGLVSLMRANQPWDRGGALRRPSLTRRIRDRLAFAAASFNEATSSRKNVAHHYDIGNALYRLMLDSEHMQYSCAYWPREDMTLGEAQEAKLAHIAAKLALAPGQRVLDIGCGWGGMAIYLAQKADVRVHAITLSEEQLALASERADLAGVSDRIMFELVDYRDLPRRGEKFDRIVSVGMFEHVGRPQFETFFRACANLLTDDGVMLLHTIGRFGKPGSTDAFTNKYIFPGGYIPALSETVAASEKARLIASDVETLRLHYARTLREWYRRCEANRAAIVGMFDERFYRMWTFYLSGATAAFESGGMCNYQIQYARNRNALPLTRDYLHEAESALIRDTSRA